MKKTSVIYGIAMCLCVSLVCMGCAGKPAEQKNAVGDVEPAEENHSMDLEEDAQYKEATEHWETDFDVNEFRKKNEKIFAGTFIDENGRRNVNVAGDETSIDKESLKNVTFKINYVEHTFRELMRVNNLLGGEMAELNIKSAELDEINNEVVVYLPELTDEAMKKINERADTTAIRYVQWDKNLELQY